MIKLICFDLDGVLIDAKKIHFEAFNKALEKINKKLSISYDLHLKEFDGLSTKKKLKKLSEKYGLSESEHKLILNEKQKITTQLIHKNINFNEEIFKVFELLKTLNYKIAVVSNSIRNTIEIALLKLEIYDFVDVIISNEDVENNKPHCEPYLKAMVLSHCSPLETLIFEDNPVGIRSAIDSKANLCIIKSPNEITLEKILNEIKEINLQQKDSYKWTDRNLNIVIPMAGASKRFFEAGYFVPKPLIPINEKIMIHWVIDNISINANYIFIVQKEHIEKFKLDLILKIIKPDCKIIIVEKLTEGAACTVLLAKELINNNNPLWIINSDQFIKWDPIQIMYEITEKNYDGCILTFKDSNSKWSFARVDQDNFVLEVAEKNPISNIATVGMYYFKHGSDFVRSAEQMIEKNIRTNEEFYVCPVFNEAIQNGLKIKNIQIDEMNSLGTPDDLQIFIEKHK